VLAVVAKKTAAWRESGRLVYVRDLARRAGGDPVHRRSMHTSAQSSRRTRSTYHRDALLTDCRPVSAVRRVATVGHSRGSIRRLSLSIDSLESGTERGYRLSPGSGHGGDQVVDDLEGAIRSPVRRREPGGGPGIPPCVPLESPGLDPPTVIIAVVARAASR